MKKLSILFVSVLTLGLAVTSCSHDDDNASIEGKWQITEVGEILNGKEVLQPYTNEGGCANDILEFTADGKFVDTYSEYYNNKCNDYSENGTWTRDGNTLTKKYGTGADDNEKYEISELSGSKLKLQTTYSEGGITVSDVAVYKKI